tara:strand:- start:466 stop:609 length:144 start_codon:yes stop_codon:yes gene_type:complete
MVNINSDMAQKRPKIAVKVYKDKFTVNIFQNIFFESLFVWKNTFFDI